MGKKDEQDQDQQQVNSDADADAVANAKEPDLTEQGGHPAWASILDSLPEEFHSAIRPELEKWDKGVQDRFKEIHDKYDAYKPYVDNEVDPKFIDQALNLAQALEEDPGGLVEQAIEAFGLDYVLKEAAAADVNTNNNSKVDNDSDELDEDYSDSSSKEFDLKNDPRYKAMEETVTKLSKQFDDQTEKEKAAEEQAEFDETLKTLETDHGKFDKTYVTALMSNGIDGATAVKQYQDTINQAAAELAKSNNVSTDQKDDSDDVVVMGGSGTTGSGLSSEAVNVGSMKNADLDKLVLEMINSQNT